MIYFRCKKLVFYNEGGKTQAQAAQRGIRCPIPGNIAGQVGWCSGQSDLVEDVYLYCRGLGLHDLKAKHSFFVSILYFDECL